MTPSAFAAMMLPYARQVEQQTGVPAWAVITQWALETGNGSSPLFVNDHNPAGMTRGTNPDGSLDFWTFPSLDAGVAEYIAFLQMPIYTGIRNAGAHGILPTLQAMGASPWDGGHYGSPAGQSLVNLWNSTYAALAGQPASTADPTSLYRGLWLQVVALIDAVGAHFVEPFWASAGPGGARLLGTVPDLASGANYLAALLQGVAIKAAPATSWTPTGTVPAGAVDPAVVLGPVYVGLVHAAEALGTDILAPAWARSQGLSGHQLGHPPDLDTGVVYLASQVAAVTSTVGATPPPVSSPPAGSGGSSGGPGPVPPPPGAPPSSGGTGVPLPPAPTSGGSGQAGLESAWAALQQLLTVTVPAAAAAMDAAIGALAGSADTTPHHQ